LQKELLSQNNFRNLLLTGYSASLGHPVYYTHTTHTHTHARARARARTHARTHSEYISTEKSLLSDGR